jgi:hypothetical protein
MTDEVRAKDDEMFVTGGTTAPRFCPRCRREAAAESELCEHCGERVVDQGYCPVCVRFWRLEAPAPCPKHDLPLEPAPPRPEFPAAGKGHLKWVTVGTFADTLQAEAPRIRLEAEGIPTFLEGARMGGGAMYHVAIGGVKLQVPQALASDARILLSQSWSPAVVPGDDLDDAWDDLAPEPGTGPGMFTVMEVAVFILFVGPLVLGLLALLLRG